MSSVSHATLLQIAQVIALSDGSVSSEEESLIRELPQRLGISSTAVPIGEHRPSMAAMAAKLESHGDRCLAVRIACLVAGVSRNPGDDVDINAEERSSYRELLAALHLPDHELAEIEWSAREELKQGKPLLQLIGDVLFGEG